VLLHVVNLNHAKEHLLYGNCRDKRVIWGCFAGFYLQDNPIPTPITGDTYEPEHLLLSVKYYILY
jgi:hypothetical protein